MLEETMIPEVSRKAQLLIGRSRLWAFWRLILSLGIELPITSLLRVVVHLAVYTSLMQFGIDGAVRAALVTAQAADAV